MRLVTLIVMLVAGLSVPGCIYVPPVWDIGQGIPKIDQIEEGTTNREEVLKLLGEPDTKTENQFWYGGSTSSGYIIFGNPYGGPVYSGLIDKEYWWIRISFDENGVVQVVSTSIDRAAAEQGDVDAQHRLAISEQERREAAAASEQQRRKAVAACEIPFAEAVELNADMRTEYYKTCRFLLPPSSAFYWMWTCLASHNNHKGAQRTFGHLNSIGLYAARQAYVRAYVWLSLSSTPYALAAREELVPRMTSDQIAEAERLVAKWEPNPAECEIEAAQAEN